MTGWLKGLESQGVTKRSIGTTKVTLGYYTHKGFFIRKIYIIHFQLLAIILIVWRKCC